MITLIDIKTCNLTLKEAMAKIEEYLNSHLDGQVWMDGDRYAIMAEDKI